MPKKSFIPFYIKITTGYILEKNMDLIVSFNVKCYFFNKRNLLLFLLCLFSPRLLHIMMQRGWILGALSRTINTFNAIGTFYVAVAVVLLLGASIVAAWATLETIWASAQLRSAARLALTSSAMELQIWQCHSCGRSSLLEADGAKPAPACLSPGHPRTTKTPVKADRSARAGTPGTKWRWCWARSGETRVRGRSSIYWPPKLTSSADARYMFWCVISPECWQGCVLVSARKVVILWIKRFGQSATGDRRKITGTSVILETHTGHGVLKLAIIKMNHDECVLWGAIKWKYGREAWFLILWQMQYVKCHDFTFWHLQEQPFS